MDDALFEVSESSALFSDDGLYRYVLGRRWDDGPVATFVMLNPSTADATKDDPTVARCRRFARDWGMAGLHVLNIYALRSTDPKGLWLVDDPVGPANDEHLTRHLTLASRTGWPMVAAWGANARPDRVEQVLSLPGARAWRCLGVTKDGAPRHPLYMPATSTPRPWPVTAP